jgi:DNA ligase-associated metallophosphoesterase
MVLRADRTLWLPEGRTLVVSDLHLGKAAVFRHHGLAVPEGDTERDLGRLSEAIGSCGAGRLVIAGDFFHAPAAQSAEVLAAVRGWRERHAGLAVRLVVGNHDRGAAMPPGDLGFAVSARDWTEGGLTFVHDPEEAGDEGYAVAGHVHPVLRLKGRGRMGSGPAVPCFWVRRRVLVLPGFGTFTGGAAVRPVVGDRVYAVADGGVVEVPRALVRG